MLWICGGQCQPELDVLRGIRTVPDRSDLSALQEYFLLMNIRKLYEVESYHRKLTKILDNQFSVEKEQGRERYLLCRR